MQQQKRECVEPPNPVLEEASMYLLEGDRDLAIEALSEDVSNGTKSCEAAFYLFFLDPANKEYLNILNQPACRTGEPLNDQVIQRFISQQQEHQKCTKNRRVLRQKLKRLAGELKKEKKDAERLRFELKKLEQIRRETEKLRLNK